MYEWLIKDRRDLKIKNAIYLVSGTILLILMFGIMMIDDIRW